ncbi:hypothetical protein PGT21_027851 [Puccinia graminis f. sp. tritici]|uniref:Transcription factor TFIIIC triple barrel domain-containing protein n=1 Tax=Puccinia graminis f. sp. tritici TaxID=56615 RepID=A0A5B0RL33_PUCGR|nr:hypothetical protein PGT21_027851 [Puccinia graminis f. sp. tritici]KAA1126560.1 hypothetical protein PGTUg99_027731 [Puccinia graminis f. sp. tritici]
MMAEPSSSKTSSRTEESVPRFPFTPPLDSRWEQVNEFPSAELPISGDDEEYEWTEEVEYLTFDFGHSHAPSPINSYSGFQVLGLNTAEPYLKIGDQIYRGEYESLVGTELIMRPVSASENGKKISRQRSGTEGQGEEDEGGDEGPEEEEDDEQGDEADEGAGGGGGEKVKVSYEPLTHTHSRIRWVPVNLIEKEAGSSDPDSSSPEAVTGADRKTKKRSGAGAGGRHWASHWTKFTPRANRSKNKVVVQPQPPPETQPGAEPQPHPQSSQPDQP